MVLECFGYRVLTADDGSGARLHAAVNRDDLRLVLCGLGQDGIDVASVVGHVSSTSRAAIVLCADGSEPRNVDAVIHSGNVRAVLPKSYTVDQLLVTVKEAIRSFDAQCENR